MGFERPQQSIDDILKGLNAGEIQRGEKPLKEVELTDGITGSYDTDTNTLSFVHGGIMTHAVIHDQKVISLTLADPVTDQPRYDKQIEKRRKDYLQTLLDEEQLILSSLH